MELPLKDSTSKTLFYREQPEAFMKAIDNLNMQFVDGSIKVVPLNNYHSHPQIEAPVSYVINTYTTIHNHVVADKCTFSASHYIGRYRNNDIDVIITPRYGDKLFNYIINYATNVFLPTGSSSIEKNINANSYWLLGILWKSMLNKALTSGQTPKEYQIIIKNQKNYKGHLNVTKHIHANLCNSTRFYCQYKKLSFDNTINRTIRCVYASLKQKGLTTLINEFEQYDKFLESMGVSPHVDLSQIDSVRFSRMNAPYKPVMNLSKAILANIKAESTIEGKINGCSYFIDIADLWEMYLLKVLQRNLPNCYHVYSPNSAKGDFLLDHGMREVRPDIIIEKEGRILAVIDAKYKSYRSFGRTSSQSFFVQRDDLYQMSTYLYHYGNEKEPIIGIFTSPVECEKNETYIFSRNQNHKIGLINLNIESADYDISVLHSNEEKYAETINNLLEGL